MFNIQCKEVKVERTNEQNEELDEPMLETEEYLEIEEPIPRKGFLGIRDDWVDPFA